MTARTILTVAGLTLREAARRRVLRALAALTMALLALSAWGFSRIGAELGGLTTGEARLVASQVLNLVMFGLSLIAALGTAFLAGPTVAGEVESGIALSVFARPVRRWAVLLGKWLGLVAFGSGFVAVAGLAQFLVVKVTVGYWPPQPVVGLALLAAGFGVGLFQVTNMTQIMGAFVAAQQGAAGGFAFLARTLGVVAGVTVLAQLVAVRRAAVGLGPAAAEAFLAAGVTVALAAAVAPFVRAR